MLMRKSLRSAAMVLALGVAGIAAAGAGNTPPVRHVFVCRSPLLAFDFWKSLQETRAKGIEVTTEVAIQICAAMRAGHDPQCRRVEVAELRPIAAGWGGALALANGMTKIWFQNPDGGGWVTPEYFVMLSNQNAPASTK
ncbi:hypothetical protein [Duganella vulcania]|uniref:Uncharacterized protein n=1 Tax=Duganella vulcania TaxID=2692166 RepID=A0A845GCT0_9BURK|nr:hypothetical protein [Duganella vulcania]MYM92423.1 hypothetical protein [Duganella vulcania]